MNIFVTDKDPIISAQNLDDLRLNKMIIESASLLANAIAAHGGGQSDLPISKTSGAPFKTKAWQNHPSCLWVKESRVNYEWLLKHLISLIEELEYRTGTVHSMKNNIQIISDGARFIPPSDGTPFANCTPYRQIETINAYKLTLIYKWEHDGKAPKWTKRSSPSWYNPSKILEAKTEPCEFPWTGLREVRSKRVLGWKTKQI